MGLAIWMGAVGNGGVPRRFAAPPRGGSRIVPPQPRVVPPHQSCPSRERIAVPSGGPGAATPSAAASPPSQPLPRRARRYRSLPSSRVGMRAVVPRAEAAGPQPAGGPRPAPGSAAAGPTGRPVSAPGWGRVRCLWGAPWSPSAPSRGRSVGTRLRPHPSRHRRPGGREEPGAAPPGAPTPHPRRKAADRGREGGHRAPAAGNPRAAQPQPHPGGRGRSGAGFGAGAVPPAAMGRGRAAA